MAADPTGRVPQDSGPRCLCGHVKRAHQHYRRGTDCAFCDCSRFRPARGLLRRLLGR